jgi:hypothetical protein
VKPDKQVLPFLQLTDGRWVQKAHPDPRPLYRLTDVLASSAETLVWISEGEKVADLAAGLGLVCVTSAGGSGQGNKSDWTPLAGRDCVFVPDNDEPGTKYAEAVAGILGGLEPRPTLRIVRLPNLPAGGDIEEWLEGCPDSWEPEQCKAKLEQLAAAAPPWNFEAALDAKLGLQCLADIEERVLEWLWEGRIPLGYLTLLAGEGGIGKSFVSLAIATVVSRGGVWPDRPDKGVPAGDVIIMAAEDDPADTIKPRLRAMGANLKRLSMLGTGRNEKGNPKPFTLADIATLEDVMKRRPHTRLMIIDPLPGFLPSGVDDHKNAELRAVLGPLAEFAARHRVGILGITHFNKGTTLRAVHRIVGSVAYRNSARATLCVVLDPEDKRRRFLLPDKANLTECGEGVAYRIERNEKGEAVLTWEQGTIGMQLDDVLARESTKAKQKRDKDAIDFLQAALADGPVWSEKLFDRAKQRFISSDRLYEVRGDAGAAYRRDKKDRRTYWFLVEPPRSQSTEVAEVAEVKP